MSYAGADEFPDEQNDLIGAADDEIFIAAEHLDAIMDVVFSYAKPLTNKVFDMFSGEVAQVQLGFVRRNMITA